MALECLFDVWDVKYFVLAFLFYRMTTLLLIDAPLGQRLFLSSLLWLAHSPNQIQRSKLRSTLMGSGIPE